MNDRSCIVCGQTFVPKRANAKVCSAECRRVRSRESGRRSDARNRSARLRKKEEYRETHREEIAAKAYLYYWEQADYVNTQRKKKRETLARLTSDAQRHGMAWGPSEDSIVLNLDLSIVQVALLTERTYKAASGRRDALLYPERPRKRYKRGAQSAEAHHNYTVAWRARAKLETSNAVKKGAPWTSQEDAEILSSTLSVRDLAIALGRTFGGVASRRRDLLKGMGA